MAMLPPWLALRGATIVLSLHVQPGARRTQIVGLHGERLKIAIASPAAEGRANAALLEFLAARLRIAPSSLQLIAGASGRQKRVAVHAALDAGAVCSALIMHGA